MKKIRKGFTLIELILAIFVLEIGLLGVASFYMYSSGVTKLARQETTASNLAIGLLDEQLSLSYLSLAVGHGTPVPYSNNPASPFVNYQKKVDVAYLDAYLAETYSLPDTHMKKIVITIYWTYNNEEKNYQIASIKTDH